MRWLWATTFLGISFLTGQFLAWWQLTSQGVYLGSNPSSSFFYLLTVTHAIHLLGGLGALFYLDVRVSAKMANRAKSTTAMDVTAVYWHFMDALWIYLLMLLYLGR